MASRRFDPLNILGLQRVCLSGSFFPQGTSAPTIGEGKGFTVARTGVGQFTITLASDLTFYALESLQGSVSLASGIGSVSFGAVSLTARTIALTTSTTSGTFVSTPSYRIPLSTLSSRIYLSNAVQDLIYDAGPPIAGVGGLLAADTIPSLQVSPSSQSPVVTWAATEVEEIAFNTHIPGNYDSTKPITLNFRCTQLGSTDTTQFAVQAYMDGSVVSVGGTTGNITPASAIGTSSLTIAAGDYADRTLGFTVAPTAHGTDSIVLFSVEMVVPYTVEVPQRSDIAANASNVVYWTGIFRNTVVDY